MGFCVIDHVVERERERERERFYIILFLSEERQRFECIYVLCSY